ncbi:DHHA1 domain-containing protein [Pelagibacteraceae bacterium]|nr:DHHA1 domain-containing protein [Pelagibacteraceae bacterium]
MVNTYAEVKTRIMSPKEAVDKGALAMFGEKYGEEVRVLSIGKENGDYFSTELCGGTHVKNTKDIGKFKIINQSSIAAGVRRVEALRDKQLEDYDNFLKKNKSLKEKNLKEQIDLIKKELLKNKVKPDYQDGFDPTVNIKNLNKQLEMITIQKVIKDKNKNVIKDKKIGSFILRQQILTDFPTKELRNIVDESKEEIKEGIVVSFSTFEEKVGVAVGITHELSKKYDAVALVKIASEILGGKGGGGRKDFAQAGGVSKDKIKEAFEALSKKII